MELERRRDAELLPAYPSIAGAESAEIESAEIQPPARDPSAVVGMDDASPSHEEELPFKFLVFV